MTNIVTKLTEVNNLLLKNTKIVLPEKNLLTISNREIRTPLGDILPLLSHHKSKLSNQFIELHLLKELIDELTSHNHIIRLNHIGFCYKVDSQQNEKDRIASLVQQSNYQLYQEPTNDDGMWLFVGDLTRWNNPVIELIPVEKTSDQWLDYWLPHIQIDLDTTMKGEDIELLVRSIFGDSITPFPIVINNSVCIVRNRLGTVDGVNISLDLATSARKVKELRQQIWKKIV